MNKMFFQQLLLLILMLSIAGSPASARSCPITDSLDIKIGQMIMIGIGDRTALPASDPLIKDLQAARVGGIVLFEKNIAATGSKEKLKRLTENLQRASAIPLFISIDEEGGLVHRMKPKYGFAAMPSAAYLGKKNNIDTTLFYNRRLVAEMHRAGINLNYAPTVDMAVNPANPVIVKVGRSFSADAAVVARMAGAGIQAHHEQGIKTILKHFPGHGSSTTDSHLGIADVTASWTAAELQPYRVLLRAGIVDAIMTAHIVNRRLEPAGYPGTLSKRIVQGLLRDSLGYRGVVFSDDMQMGAIAKHYGFEKAISMAINAGVDVLMFGNSVGSAQDRMTPSSVHAIIKGLVRSGKVSVAQIDAAYARIMQLKRKTY
jgi:beta-N-acetylhexosaminidase